MKRKEIIYDLEVLCDFFEEQSKAVPVCLTEAIRLLKGKSKDDLISREKAYEVLTEFYNHRTKVQHDGLREALKRVPTADIKEKLEDAYAHGYTYAESKFRAILEKEKRGETK